MDIWTVERGAKRVADIPDSQEVGPADQEKVTEIRTLLQGKLDLGRSLAYYENVDLGHPDIGFTVALTFGPPESQFPTAEFPDGPPETLPDGLIPNITGGINWRYRLAGVTHATKEN